METTRQKINRGDVYYAEFDHATGSETFGRHPVIVIQNNTGNDYSKTIIGVVLTTQRNKAEIPTHVLISNEGQRFRNSMALAEQIYTIDKRRLSAYLGHLDSDSMRLVDEAICRSLALNVCKPIGELPHEE